MFFRPIYLPLNEAASGLVLALAKELGISVSGKAGKKHTVLLSSFIFCAQHLGSDHLLQWPTGNESKSQRIYSLYPAAGLPTIHNVRRSLISAGYVEEYDWGDQSSGLVGLSNADAQELMGMSFGMKKDEGGNTINFNFGSNSNLTSIEAYAFRECESLRQVDFQNSVTPFTIGNRSFEGCTKLVSVNFGSTVTSIGAYAFKFSGVKGSNYRTTIVIPNSVTTISGGAFEFTKINYVSMSENVTVINNNLFNSSDLKSTWDLTGVTYFGGSVLSSNINLKGSLYLPNSVTTFGGGNFGGNGLTSVRFSPTITNIASYAFSGFGIQSELTNISDIGTNVTFVGSYAFACPNLKDVYFPVTSAPVSFSSNACIGLGTNRPADGSGYQAYFHVPVGATGYDSVFFPNYVNLIYDL